MNRDFNPSIPSFKFLGILNSDDIEKTDREAIKKFIELNLIKELDEDVVSDLTQFEVHYCFDFEEKSYALNKSLLDEIYSLLKFYVEEMCSDYWTEIDVHFRQLNSILNLERKIEFLENCYQNIYPVDDLFPIYKEGNHNGFENWKDWLAFNITFSFEIIKIYTRIEVEFGTNIELNKIELASCFTQELYKKRELLEGKFDESIFELLDKWISYFEKDNQLRIILDKINELTKGKKIKSRPESLKEMFGNSNRYQPIIDALIDNEVINDKLQILPQNFEDYSDLRMATCIGWVLKEKGYLNKCFDVDLCYALSKTFNLDLTAQNYSASAQLIEKAYKNSNNLNTKRHQKSAKEYLDLLQNI